MRRSEERKEEEENERYEVGEIKTEKKENETKRKKIL